MRIKIFSADSATGLDSKIDRWTRDFNPTIIDTDFTVNTLEDTSEDGRVFIKWSEYSIAVTYDLTKEQQDKIDMKESLEDEQLKNIIIPKF